MSDKTRLVVKDNSLIDASFNLSLVEQRLMLLGITEARELPKLSLETPVKVSVKSYIEQFNVSDSTAYEALQDAVNTLFERQFSYYDNVANERYKERWIYKASYMDDKGYVVMFFTPTVISMISRLEAQFTKYMLDQVSDFKSKYSIRLYEILAKWFSVGHTEKYAISNLRAMLGIEETEYKTMSLFKTNVLDKAVNEINRTHRVEYKIKYEQFKEGKTIAYIMFKMTKKKVKDDQTIDIFNDMTDKQLDMFSDKLSRLESFQNHFRAYVGEDLKDYAIRIREKLKDNFYVQKWFKFLEQVGYVATKLSK